MPYNESAWPISPRPEQHRERYSLMQSIPYEVTTIIEGPEREDDDEGEEMLLGPQITTENRGTALSLNICSGGMLLLMEGDPGREAVVKLHVPTPVLTAKTPTLAEVRWVRRLPFEDGGSDNLYFVGIKFIL